MNRDKEEEDWNKLTTFEVSSNTGILWGKVDMYYSALAACQGPGQMIDNLESFLLVALITNYNLTFKEY